MTELVLKTTQSDSITAGSVKISGLYQSAKSKIYNLVHKKVSIAELVFIAITLASLQILDGVVTAVGVMNFGPEIEANRFIRFLIESWGVVPALCTVKIFALSIIITLCTMVPRVTWLATAMKMIIVLYIFAAIIPWAMILTFATVS